MSYMLEIFYRAPADERRERRLNACAASHGGRLDYREPPQTPGGPICLTFEFDGLEQAQAAAGCLRGEGQHVEGPCAYAG